MRQRHKPVSETRERGRDPREPRALLLWYLSIDPMWQLNTPNFCLILLVSSPYILYPGGSCPSF